ncbi:MAG: hypothetical protein AABX13_00490 [Nanoarchaeota archaeon]
MKKIILLIGLVAALFLIAACVPKEGKEEGALAGQASGQMGIVKSNVKTCTETDIGVEGTDKKGKLFTYTNECKTNTKVREYFCASYSGGRGNTAKNVVKNDYFCASSETCQNGACVGQEVCGNNVIEGDEACDGTDLGDPNLATCNAQMQDPAATGTVQCAADCTYDFSGCEMESEIPTTEVVEMLEEFCFDSVDNDNDGQINEGCVPYSCAGDTDPLNITIVSGTLTVTAATGEARVFNDYCSTSPPFINFQINETSCVAGGMTNNYKKVINLTNARPCPPAATCVGSISPEGPIPAACQTVIQVTPGSCDEIDTENSPTVGGSITHQNAIHADRCVAWSTSQINETTCSNMYGEYKVCPADTFCTDSDGGAGDTPAVCQ